MKAKDIDAYIAGFPREVQEPLQAVRAAIKKAAPSLEETIKYDMPTFMLHGKNLFHFAAFKHHIGFFGVPADKDYSPYKSGKGSVQFPLNGPMPLELISSIVAAKIDQHNI